MEILNAVHVVRLVQEMGQKTCQRGIERGIEIWRFSDQATRIVLVSMASKLALNCSCRYTKIKWLLVLSVAGTACADATPNR